MINGAVSHWWQDVGLPLQRPALRGSAAFDVAIVGAGFTGLWTAYYLKQTEPSLKICILEQRHVGYGASGRNGGWLTNTITGGRERYLKSHGAQATNNFQLAMNLTVDEVIRVCASEGIDADLKKGGELEVAYTPAQESRLRVFAAREQVWPHTDVRVIESTEARAKINVAQTRAAIWHPHAAQIHPAKLVRGLAATVSNLGVEIFENSRVNQIHEHRLELDEATVTASSIVRATEGFTSRIKGHRRSWLPMNSSMIVTEPLSEALWEELNWNDGEVLGDFAHVYMYAQRTADHRIALGGRGIPYKYGSRTDLDGQTPQSTVEGLQVVLHRLFPQTAQISLDHVWSGVLGVPRDWAATVGFDRSSGIGWAGGYVGTGVTTTNLAGRTLRDLILERDTALTKLPWVNHRARLWEPEPLRWLATRGLYAAYSMADHHESRGGVRTSPIARVADVITGKN